MTGTEDAQPARDVAEALAWFRENPDRVRSVEGRLRSGRHAATIVRAALAAGPDEFGTPGDGNGVRLAQEYMERHAAARPAGDATTESHVEYRTIARMLGGDVYHSYTIKWAAQHQAKGYRDRGIEARVESRTVSTTRVETPWKAEQT